MTDKSVLPHFSSVVCDPAPELHIEDFELAEWARRQAA